MDIVCPVAHERFSVADVNILEYRLNNCPLGPVPPHGRLIDADELDKIWGLIGHDDLEAAPTIIPAEEGKV